MNALPEDMVAEVKTLKSSLLTEEHNHNTSSPVQPLSKQLLHCKLILSNYNKVSKNIIQVTEEKF